MDSSSPSQTTPATHALVKRDLDRLLSEPGELERVLGALAKKKRLLLWKTLGGLGVVAFGGVIAPTIAKALGFGVPGIIVGGAVALTLLWAIGSAFFVLDRRALPQSLIEDGYSKHQAAEIAAQHRLFLKAKEQLEAQKAAADFRQAFQTTTETSEPVGRALEDSAADTSTKEQLDAQTLAGRRADPLPRDGKT